MNFKRNISWRKKSEEREKRKTDSPEVERDIYQLIRLVAKEFHLKIDEKNFPSVLITPEENSSYNPKDNTIW